MFEKAAPKKNESKGKEPVSKATNTGRAVQAKGATVSKILDLQQTVGNQAVQRMIESGAIRMKNGAGHSWGGVRSEVGQFMKQQEESMSSEEMESEDDTVEQLKSDSASHSGQVIQRALSAPVVIALAAALGLAAVVTIMIASVGLTQTWIWLNAKIKGVNLVQSLDDLTQVWNNVPALSVGQIVDLGTIHAGINVAGMTHIVQNIPPGRSVGEIVQLANTLPQLTAQKVVLLMAAHPGIAVGNILTTAITGVLTSQDNFGGHSAAHLGVGERADLSVAIVPGTITVPEVGGLTWQSTAGTGVVDLVNTANGTARFTAPETASNEQLSLVVVAGHYTGTVVDVLNRAAVAPLNWGLVEQSPGTGIIHTQNLVGVGFSGRFRIRAPQAVSFGRLQHQEDSNGGVVGVGTNCVIAKNGEVHNPNAATPGVNNGDASAATGVTVNNVDRISTPHFPVTAGWYRRNLGSGTFTWDIEWFYNVQGSANHHRYTIVRHLETYTIDATAAMDDATTITKGGSGNFTKRRTEA